MKKLLLPLAIAGMCALPSLSNAATNPYVSLSGGLGLMNNSTVDGFSDAVEYKTGFLVNGAVGLKTEPVRLEAEIGYHRNAIDKAFGHTVTDENISIWSFMANGYLDYDMKDEGISPFIMAGLGYASVSDNWTGGSSSDGAFAWQIGAGLGIKASDKVTFDVSYRYFKTGDVTLHSDTVTTGSHNILAGLRIDI
ncbi:MAG: porin family protein [Chlorobiaceae bacterium]|nr:porin family protein [Chlorobiaceae bacterium]